MSDQVSLPSLIAAEAIVVSDRTGYQSILESTLDITPENVKLFFADAHKMKTAYQRLKEQGFRILSSDNISINIIGAPGAYERAFGKKIIVKESASSSSEIIFTSDRKFKNILIDTKSNPVWNDILGGVLLSQPLEVKAATPPVIGTLGRTANDLVPDAIREALQGNGTITEFKGTGSDIILIDDGAYLEHDYFNSKTDSISLNRDFYDEFLTQSRESLSSIKAKLQALNQTLRILEQDAKSNDISKQLSEFIFPQYYKLSSEIKALISEDEFQTLNFATEENKITSGLEGLKAELTKANEFIAKRNQLINPELHTQIHGTAMLTNILAIASEAKVEIRRLPYLENEEGDSSDSSDSINSEFPGSFIMSPLPVLFQTLKEQKSKIISCSWGNYESDDPQEDKLIVKKNRLKFASTDFGNSIIVMALGNKNEKNRGALESHYKAQVILVGGAFYEAKSDISTLTYSNDSLGTAEASPSLCGWCGKVLDGGNIDYGIWTPDVNNTWSRSTGGTSSATAQISGVCALILQMFRKHEKLDFFNQNIVRAILVRSADQISNGISAQNINARALKVGMVNIDHALICAEFLIKVLASKIDISSIRIDEFFEGFETDPVQLVEKNSETNKELYLTLEGEKKVYDFEKTVQKVIQFATI